MQRTVSSASSAQGVNPRCAALPAARAADGLQGKLRHAQSVVPGTVGNPWRGARPPWRRLTGNTPVTRGAPLDPSSATEGGKWSDDR